MKLALYEVVALEDLIRTLEKEATLCRREPPSRFWSNGEILPSAGESARDLEHQARLIKKLIYEP